MQPATTRRKLLRDGMLLGVGLTAGACAPSALRMMFQSPALAEDHGDPPSAEQRLRDRGITLPPPPQPVAVYIPAVRVGNLLYTSGHIPKRADGSAIVGKVGQDLTLEQGFDAARLVGVNVLSSVRHALGSLDKVARLVKVLGVVNCVSSFTQQPQVINGFSELMIEIFGEADGKAARSAIGAGSLPGNMAVEVEAIFEIRS
ncbi:RidA family protein [Lignipirellula cremea]|uniref:Endoribonuclease L-PSP n=1 Tax=Lignipirellula cremea TaxID=2528010 RepID=A0A518E4L1_9BACT|nr:RidA family protein [Lignipirellula cremea]QDU99003.1 Endoribonuclease L-PSP [Lignipirellula cremea]